MIYYYWGTKKWGLSAQMERLGAQRLGVQKLEVI